MRTIKELNLCDDFLFHEVMKDKDLVIGLLETVLDLKGKIIDIKYIEEEKTIKSGYSGKGVRLDVYVLDNELNVYDIEIQNGKLKVIGKRSRKYQSNMDGYILRQGQGYEELKKQYIIFICTGDPFGQGLYKYTFSNRCHEIPSLSLGDETYKIILNTKGTVGEISPDLKEFLYFIEHSTQSIAEKSNSQFIKALSKKVETVKQDDESRGEFMTFEEKMQEYAELYVEEHAEEIEERVTQKITEEVTERVTEEVTERVTEEVTERVTEEVANERNIFWQNEIQNKTFETARAMKNEGIEIALISKITKLSVEEIESM